MRIALVAVFILLLGGYLMNKTTVDKAVRRFALSARSRTELTGVHPDLVRVVKRALQLTPL